MSNRICYLLNRFDKKEMTIISCRVFLVLEDAVREKALLSSLYSENIYFIKELPFCVPLEN